MTISNEYRLSLACARIDPNTIEIRGILKEKPLNWDYVMEYSIRHDIQPLLYWNLNQIDTDKEVPEKVMAILKKNYYQNVLHNMSIYDQLGIVLSAFINSGIKVIVLKGAFLAEIVYINIGLRSLGDIDLLIGKEDLQKAKKELAGLGYDYPVHPTMLHEILYDKLDTNKEIHFTNQEKKILIDIHWDIIPSDIPHKIDINAFWNNAQSIKIAGIETLALSVEDLLFHLCLHLDKHIDDECDNVAPFQLKGFCDVAEVIKFYNGNINWKYLVQSSENCRIKYEMYQVLYIVNKFFGVLVPEDVLNDIRTAQYDTDFEDIFRSLSALESSLKKKKRNKEQKEFSYINRVSKIDGIWNKLKFIFGDIFPCKEFMIQHYNIKKNNLICIYYFIRFGIALRWVINVLYRSLFSLNKFNSKKG